MEHLYCHHQMCEKMVYIIGQDIRRSRDAAGCLDARVSLQSYVQNALIETQKPIYASSPAVTVSKNFILHKYIMVLH